MRYIVGFLIGIGLIVLTFILIIRIFSGGGDTEQPRKIDLNSYATTDTVMRLTMDGPIVADARHQQLRITVGRDNVLYERFQGYQGDVIDSRQYPNNPDAYAEFLHALTVAGYANGNPNAQKDERGYCPTGYRFVYEAIGDGENIVRWWNTSCGAKQGNFNGNGASVRELFKRQVPDYREVTRNTIFAR
jgi:hypothetical protein